MPPLSSFNYLSLSLSLPIWTKVAVWSIERNSRETEKRRREEGEENKTHLHLVEKALA
jgi:hypothetical protein